MCLASAVVFSQAGKSSVFGIIHNCIKSLRTLQQFAEQYKHFKKKFRLNISSEKRISFEFSRSIEPKCEIRVVKNNRYFVTVYSVHSIFYGAEFF